MLDIDDATAADWDDLDARMRKEDRAELIAATVSVDALRGYKANALRMDGELVCLFGLEPFPGERAIGVPWMISTETLGKVPPHAMAAVSARVVARWKEQHHAMTNFVHRHNRGAIRFLRWLGFTIIETPTGRGSAFYQFQWERGNV